MTAIQHASQSPMPLAHASDYTQDQLNLIRATLAPETNDMEFALFMEVARVQGLSPLQRQIHAVMRWSDGKKKMVIQTGIDGYRLIAARTGLHLGTTDATFGPLNADGFPAWAQVTVKKLVHGHVAEYPATAFWDEYVQTTKNGQPNKMWAQRPKGQLSKCAEALALRKAFPAELSGVYTDTEMDQADNPASLVQVEHHAVQQEGKAAPAQDPMEARMKLYGPKLASRREAIKKYGIKDAEVTQFLADLPDWRASDENAENAVAKLTEWGTGLKAAQQPAADVVDAELVPVPSINDGQRKALMAHLSRGALPNTSEARSGFYAYLKPGIEPGTRTNDLTAEQAHGLLDLLSGMDTDSLSQAVAEYLKGAAK